MSISILGKNIKRIREMHGISAYRLSKLANVGTTTIGEIERGKRQSLNSTTVEKIANALNISADKLLEVEVNQEYEVDDIEQIVSAVAQTDDLKLDDVKLNEIERLQIQNVLNAVFTAIRTQRKNTLK